MQFVSVAPPADASNLAWALWYHECGLWAYPGRDAQDLRELFDREYERLLETGLDEEAASAAATRRRDRSRKHTFIAWRQHTTPPTTGQIRRWFAERPERPIILLTGPGRGITVIDVDVAKGADASPWIDVPCLARTAGGGYHAVHLEAEDIASSETKLAPFVDVRGIGGLIVAPSGPVATPGRSWLRLEPPDAFPEKARAALTRAAPPTSQRVLGAVADESDDELDPSLLVGPTPEDKSFTAAMLERAPDGTRMRRIKAIVGMLAQRHALPRDAREAAIDLCRTWAARRRFPADVSQVLERAWLAHLRASERDAHFALDVATAWNETRCSPPWEQDRVEQQVAGLWKTAQAREVTREREQQSDDDSDDDLDAFLPSFAACYNADDFAEDRRRGLLSCASLPPWADHRGELAPTKHGHGWGDGFDAALGGGLAPRYFLVLGAETAKTGKTAFLMQIIAGCALRSAAIIAGAASGPIIVPYYIGEMDQGAGEKRVPIRQLMQRELSRWLGVDSQIFRRGDARAYEAPGLRRLAEAIGAEPAALATSILDTAQDSLREGPFRRALDMLVAVKPRALRAPEDAAKGEKPIDHRRGVPLLRAFAAAVERDRERKAKKYKCEPSRIWPLAFFDPIQRYTANGENAVSTLDEFVEEMRAVTDEHGWITVATSDTNKESAKGGVPKNASPFARAAFVFRGSYKLLHLPDAAAVLHMTWPKPDEEGHPLARLWLALNRWGPPSFEPFYYDFHPECGRFISRDPPVKDEPEEDEEEEEEIVAEQPKEQPRKRGKFTRKQ